MKERIPNRMRSFFISFQSFNLSVPICGLISVKRVVGGQLSVFLWLYALAFITRFIILYISIYNIYYNKIRE
jgi:hypothetical protein